MFSRNADVLFEGSSLNRRRWFPPFPARVLGTDNTSRDFQPPEEAARVSCPRVGVVSCVGTWLRRAHLVLRAVPLHVGRAWGGSQAPGQTPGVGPPVAEALFGWDLVSALSSAGSPVGDAPSCPHLEMVTFQGHGPHSGLGLKPHSWFYPGLGGPRGAGSVFFSAPGAFWTQTRGLLQTSSWWQCGPRPRLCCVRPARAPLPLGLQPPAGAPVATSP